MASPVEPWYVSDLGEGRQALVNDNLGNECVQGGLGGLEAATRLLETLEDVVFLGSRLGAVDGSQSHGRPHHFLSWNGRVDIRIWRLF